MTNRWTDAQREAISFVGNNLLVTAGAGSGKTAVLTERIARLALDGCLLRNMLVVTFTKAAASEMRQRVQKRLESTAETGDERQKRIARDQLERFAQANISTMHSFCTSVLRRHFHVLGLDPAFRVGDELECAVLRQDAAEEAIEAAFEAAEAAGERAVFDAERAFCDKREPLDALMRRIYSFLQSIPEPWGWLDRAVATYAADAQAVAESPYFRARVDQARQRLAEGQTALAEAVRFLCGEAGAENMCERLAADCAVMEKAIEAFDSGRSDALKCLITHSFVNMQSYPRKYAQLCKSDVDARQKCAKACREETLAIELDPAVIADTLNAMHPALCALAALVRDFDARYAEAKRKKGILDFSDLEHMTLAALEHESVRDEYRARFRHVFVDEYQDTNRVQEAIFERIVRGGNGFFVGDVKQSIYGFRLADPSIFLERDAAYAVGRGGKSIPLRENFRSDPNVLEAVNDIFYRVMEPIGGLPYTANEALVAGRKTDGEVRPVTIDVLYEADADAPDSADTAADPSPDETEFDSDAEREAMFAVRWIRERMARQVRGRDGKMRACRYADFAILLRSTKGRAEGVARIFAQEGIPAYAELKRGYFEAVEVRVLIDMLRLIDNRQRDLPLLAVLRAGVGGLSDADIVAIRARHASTRERKVSFYRAFAACASAEDALGARCKGFLSMLDEARDRARAMPLDALIEWLIEETQYGSMTAALPGGEQRSANLDVLRARARVYENVSGRGLYGFLRYLDRVSETGQDMGEARLIGEGSDCVRIMSVHASKGLEFPYVLLLDTGKEFNFTDCGRRLLLHREVGIGARYWDSQTNARAETILQDTVKRRMRTEIEAEEMRMLYVALTRAREELGIVGTLRRRRKRLEARIAGWCDGVAKESLLDYVMDAAIGFDAAEELCKTIGISEAPATPANACWRIAAVDASTLRPGQADLALQKRFETWKQNAVHTDTTAMAEHAAWRYTDSRIPGKVAVSSLASGRLSFDETPRFLQRDRMTAADVGTATHIVLERIDWKKPLDQQGIAAQIQHLVAREYLSAEQAESVDVGRIARFCASPLGKRMRDTKRLERELPFTIRIPATLLPDAHPDASGETTVLQGTIDACFAEKDAWILVDYKSDRLFDDNPETWHAAATKHARQLRLYAQALQTLTGQPVTEAYVFLLAAGEAIPVAL